MRIPDLFDRAVGEFHRYVGLIGEDSWVNPTPCTEWSVRDLVNHVVVEDLWAPGLLAGKTIDEIGGMNAFDGDQLGDDPKSAWTLASRGATDAVRSDGAMERTTHLSFGDVPGATYTEQLLADHVIHAWDLAKGIGADDTLDPELVGHVYEGLKPYADSLSGSGSYGPQIETAGDADTQTKLLALVGRKR